MTTRAVIGICVASLGVAALAFSGAAGADQAAIAKVGTLGPEAPPGGDITVPELLAIAAIAGGLALALVDWIRQ